MWSMRVLVMVLAATFIVVGEERGVIAERFSIE